jgi:phosphoserine phosphatase RsbU/P
MLRLIGTDGDRLFSYLLEPGSYIIGRHKESDIPIPHRTVSRQHARIEIEKNGQLCLLTDLGSHNGTFINGVRIESQTEIKTNDKIMFGHTEFHLSSDDSADTAPVVSSRTKLTDYNPEKSIFLSIDEALQPLPKNVTDRPELLPTIFEMARMLSRHEPKGTMLNRSLELIARLVPSDRLAILTVAPEQDEVFVAATLLPGGKSPGEFTLSRTIVNEIMSNKKSILISNPLEDDRFAGQQSIIMSEMKSAIAVPLFDEGKVLGILYADTTNPLHSYTDDYLRVMAACGNIIASRLLNYELMAERQEREIIDAELKRASMIQRKLLVLNPPQIDGFNICAYQKQSRSVGGDLYDVKLLPDGRLLFLVADVSGKGMGAALLMTNIIASFRILYDNENLSLTKIVERVSIQLHKYTDPGDFATLFIGLIDPADKKILYLNAGHNPPVITRREGGCEYLEASGFMIGAFDFGQWEENCCLLGKGDTLCVYSDGVSEAECCTEEQYGEERLCRLLADTVGMDAKNIVGQIMKNLDEFTGDTPQSDDITMLIIKRDE